MGGLKLVETTVSSNGREDEPSSWPSSGRTVFGGAMKLMTRRKMSVLKKAKRRMILSE